jgi:hypothetical protein
VSHDDSTDDETSDNPPSGPDPKDLDSGEHSPDRSSDAPSGSGPGLREQEATPPLQQPVDILSSCFPLFENVFSMATCSDILLQDTAASISVASDANMLLGYTPCAVPRFANGVGGSAAILGYGEHAGI